MTNAEYKVKYSKYLDLFNKYCEKVFCDVESDNNLTSAMKYSFFAGGKRIRPILSLALAESFCANLDEVLPFALAIECIHTYSLIHDDLPALDNDVLRRGKPTCHVKYDESTAILAGDALLNFAFEHVLMHSNSSSDISALLYLAECSGYKGMLSGQQTDVESENVEGNEELLLKIHELKTCKLLTAPLVISAIKFNPTKKSLCEEFGYLAGLIFQFSDDLLDVLSSADKFGKSVGKDEKSGKFTSVKLYGIDNVKLKIETLSQNAVKIANLLDNTGFLQCFINEITGRINEN